MIQDFKICAEVLFNLTQDGTQYNHLILYECDPAKNVECRKGNCHIRGGECRRTHDLKYAKIKEVFEE